MGCEGRGYVVVYGRGWRCCCVDCFLVLDWWNLSWFLLEYGLIVSLFVLIEKKKGDLKVVCVCDMCCVYLLSVVSCWVR